jgi:putative ABC transport system ATP-binding protein
VITADRAALAEAIELGKWWADGAGLRPVSFTLAAGELVVVRGRSGSGKSTLLALLAGWASPDSGELRRLGPWSLTTAGESWRATAILPQVLAPIAELTMTENVALPLRLSGTKWTEARRRARAVLERLDLSSEADRAATDSSLGQQQRMALARAVVIDPVVLLADEPTSHQDAGHTSAVLAVLRAVVAAGTCAVVASHDPAVAEVADRVLDLDA